MRFITSSSETGYSCTKRDNICMVQRLCDHKGLQLQESTGWWTSFQKWQLTLAMRHAESIAHTRVIASENDVLEKCYDMRYPKVYNANTNKSVFFFTSNI